jgi:hypothetical protein
VAVSTTDETGSSCTMNTSWMKKTKRPTPIEMEARSTDSVPSSPNMPRFQEMFSATAATCRTSSPVMITAPGA